MTAAAIAHLATVLDHWDDLTDALATPSTTSWPPSGLRNYLASLDACDAAEVREQRAQQRGLERSPEQIGATAAPISITVYDTMRAVEAALVHLADVTAAVVQRPSMSHAPLDWPRADRDRRNLLADADAMDERRWRYHGTRTAVQAADWLSDRLANRPGPFTRLTDGQAAHIATVASGAADRVEAALDLTRRAAPVQWPCPGCRGELVVSGGDGQPPAVECQAEACGWKRTAEDTLAA